nr:uncharacterized protein LOC113807846 [Penaeus vannamei]
MYKMWAQVVATRSRRCVACVVLACILLTVQVITHQVRQEAVVDESMNPQQLTTMLKQDEEGFKLPIIPAKGFDLRAAQVGKAKGDILKNLSELDIKQLQKVQQFVNSAHDPQAVEEFRIDQALQSLKVRLLEEIRTAPEVPGDPLERRPEARPSRQGPPDRRHVREVRRAERARHFVCRPFEGQSKTELREGFLKINCIQVL